MITKETQQQSSLTVDSPSSVMTEFSRDTDDRIIHVLGIPIHRVTMRETINKMISVVKERKFAHVVTVNPEFIMLAQRDAEFRNVLQSATLATADGIGVVLASRLMRRSISERVTGVDLVRQFAGAARDHSINIFFLGAAPGVAEKAARVLEQEHPGLKIAGTFSGSPHPDDLDEILHRIREVKTDVLFVAFGAPKQDIWINRYKDRTGVAVAVGVGGAFDFIAGVTQRAPSWIQTLGLEWLHRLVRQPSRWKRMLNLPRFALAVLRARLVSLFP